MYSLRVLVYDNYIIANIARNTVCRMRGEDTKHENGSQCVVLPVFDAELFV